MGPQIDHLDFLFIYFYFFRKVRMHDAKIIIMGDR